jgi:hypothetical protein
VRPRLRADQAGDLGLAHEPLHALARDHDAVAETQLGLDRARLADLAVIDVDLFDAIDQPRVGEVEI